MSRPYSEVIDTVSIMHMHNGKLYTFKGNHISGNRVFPYNKGPLLKERISSLRELILSFKRSPYSEEGHN